MSKRLVKLIVISDFVSQPTAYYPTLLTSLTLSPLRFP
jgi:hypothetical protein